MLNASGESYTSDHFIKKKMYQARRRSFHMKFIDKRAFGEKSEFHMNFDLLNGHYRLQNEHYFSKNCIVGTDVGKTDTRSRQADYVPCGNNIFI